jgi:hypothetical protein
LTRNEFSAAPGGPFGKAFEIQMCNVARYSKNFFSKNKRSERLAYKEFVKAAFAPRCANVILFVFRSTSGNRYFVDSHVRHAQRNVGTRHDYYVMKKRVQSSASRVANADHPPGVPRWGHLCRRTHASSWITPLGNNGYQHNESLLLAGKRLTEPHLLTRFCISSANA